MSRFAIKSFRSRIIIAVAVIELMFLLVIVFSALNLIHASNERELGKRALVAAQLFASATTDAVLSTDLATLQSFVGEILTDPEIVYARVRNESTVLAEGGDAAALARPFHADHSYTDAARDNVFDVGMPITVQNEYYGQVELGFSLAALRETLHQARTETVIIVVVEMGLALVLALLLGRYLSRGLERLSEAARRIAAGEFGYTMTIKGDDELSMTGTAFNVMSHRLRELDTQRTEAEREIIQLNKDLEKRVRKRTEELAEVNKRLEHQALHDELTGLANRTLFQNRLRHAAAVARRHKTQFAVLMIDLDGFKEINDRHGHKTGDVALEQIAHQLETAVRESDTLARLGGDEFGIVLPDIHDAEAAQSVARRVVERIDRPVTIGTHTFTVGASLGIAIYPRHGEDPDTLMQAADTAMYVAKRRGGGIEMCASKRQTSASIDISLGTELRHAIDHGELVLHCQPKFDCAEQSINGVELVACWPHPQRGLIPADQLAVLADQHGLARALNRWTLVAATGQWRRWREQGQRFTLSLNLYGADLATPSVAEEISSLIGDDHEIRSWLDIEVPNAAVAGNPDTAVTILERLRALDLHLTIDHYVPALSSASALKRLPVSRIKLDRALTTEMASDHSGEVIVKSMVDLGHELGLQVMVDGVESPDILDRLQQLGCDYLQGESIGPWMPAGEFTDWIASCGNGNIACVS